MTDELSTRTTLGAFYKWLEKQGLIDEEVRSSAFTRENAVNTFITSWPEDAAPLAGTERQLRSEDEWIEEAVRTPEPELPLADPGDLLILASKSMDDYLREPLGARAMKSAILTENYALLSIAGYLKKIFEE